VKAIKESKHFVYIENQFFVSNCTKVANPVNRLIGALVERISKAIESKQPFRAIFICPLHSSSPLHTKTLQNLTYWQLSSMFKGPNSMMGELKRRFPDVDPENYVTISCLRNWGKFKSGDYSNEMVYIHSKLMIVDDTIVFCSSANVNDRSMQGDRDSEIGVRIVGNEKIDIKMGGESFQVSRIGHELRTKAMARFTGRKQDDPEISDAVLFFDDWRKIAASNQEIYMDVFQVTVETLEDPKDCKIIQDYNHTLKARNVERLQDIQGYVVPYPTKLFEKSYKQPDEHDLLVNFYC
jgi:phospholipase D1/2